MTIVTWRHQCCVCRRPIHGGNPTLLFSIQEPLLIGIAHAKCSYKGHHGQFWTCPPYFLSPEHVSFLAQSYPRLYALPGHDKPNSDLRRCVARFMHDYPGSLDSPMEYMRRLRDEDQTMTHVYDGDIEGDFLRFLAEVHRAAKENPIDIGVDFRKRRST